MIIATRRSVSVLTLTRQILPILFILCLAFAFPRLGARLFRRAEALLAGLARHPRRSTILVFLLGALSAASVSLIFGLPKPAVHDEFSYLLAADTFAHARLTNPTPPLWTHFETFHVLLKPTYMSKYPPAQGLTLALGQALVGLPIVGIWLANGLACAALYWMLRAWMPPRWALLGGLMACFHLTLLEWSGNYWGGTVAVLGGALALGGFRWLTRAPSPLRAVGFGLGIAILAISRPYEGFIYTLALLAALIGWAWRQERRFRRILLKQAAFPTALIVCAMLIFLGLYNNAVTHDPLRLPYEQYERTYGVARSFLFQRPRPIPVYHNAQMRDYALGEQMRIYNRQQTLHSFLTDALRKARIATLGYLRPFSLIVPLLTLLLSLRTDRWMRKAALIYLVFVVGMSVETTMYLHYTAPIMGLIWLFIQQGMRYMRVWRPYGKPVGRFLMRCIVLVYLVSVAKWYHEYGTLRRGIIARERPRLLAQMAGIPGRHLVLVRYSPDHNVDEEWVYNGADIDGERVVWARALGGSRDKDLLDYFKNRRLWLLEADKLPIRLQPYPFTLTSAIKSHIAAASDLRSEGKAGATNMP